MRQFLTLCLCALLLAGPTLADPTFETAESTITFRSHGTKWFLLEIIPKQEGLRGSQSIILKPAQVLELKQAFDKNLAAQEGGSDQNFTFKGNLGKNSAELIMIRYRTHRTRAFLLQITGKTKKNAYLTVSKSESQLKLFTQFMESVAAEVK